MTPNRILEHPILTVHHQDPVAFFWNRKPLTGYSGEMIATALFANGIRVFGYHPKDHSPQGIFCANGQCAQCLVIADGLPVKACMTPLKAGMRIESLDDLPRLPAKGALPSMRMPPVKTVDVLIIGAGPAGLTAAIELGKCGVDTLLVDDKDRVGGKLILQTHKFFGSVEDSHAGTRGFDIAKILSREIETLSSVKVWLNSTVLGVFSDGIVGVVRDQTYMRIRPQRLLVATGARELMLSFPGNTLPGVYGAGAFQTLVNRDRVKPAGRVLIVGGGNVGLIAGYHAIQAGIAVVALIEALPEVGGYQVHADKLKRLGIPILTRHTVVSADGDERVHSVTVAKLEDRWQVIPGTFRSFSVDTVLIAVGLVAVDDFYRKAAGFGMAAFCAGDAHEIAEASSAMVNGKIKGLNIARSLGRYSGEIPVEWKEKARQLKSRPGPVMRRKPPAAEKGVFPVFHCNQEIPCDPCTAVCPEGIIRIHGPPLTGLASCEDIRRCKGCMRCVAVCPGLSVTLVDYRKDRLHPMVTFACELGSRGIDAGRPVAVIDDGAGILGHFTVERVFTLSKKFPGTLLVQIKLPKSLAKKAAGVRLEEPQASSTIPYEKEPLPDAAVVCRCERVTAGEIRTAIRDGVSDVNQLKALLRVGMGACGGKNCRPMVMRMFKEEGMEPSEITDGIDRPLFVEVPMGILAGAEEDGGGD